jgi:hypothetical protein
MFTESVNHLQDLGNFKNPAIFVEKTPQCFQRVCLQEGLKEIVGA